MISLFLATLAGTACLDADGVRAAGPLALPAMVATVPADSQHQALWASGRSFADFLESALQRREEWRRNHAEAVVADALLERVARVGGPWKFLVVAVDGCSDSVNSIPYLARLVERAPGLDLRIVNATEGRAVMEAHRTPDGRAATPTVILLDEAFAERGCWVERPTELQSWIMAQRGTLSDGDIFNRKMQWYAEEKGAKSLEEYVVLMEEAAAGRAKCA